MTLAPSVFQTVKDYHQTVIAIDNPKIVQAAHSVAYYSAMITAAVDDPFEDDEEQREMMTFLSVQYEMHIKVYMDLVNDEL